MVDPASLHLSVAGKEYPVTTEPVAATRRTTMIVVDTSGSMGISGMAAVRTAVAAFLQTVPPDVNVGLVSFAASAAVDVAPTTDHGAIQAAVNRLKSSGETTLYDGVKVAINALGSDGDRSIVLLSDGADTRSSATKPQSVDALRQAGIRAEVIGFKTGYSDNAVLGELAAAGQGSVAAAENPAAVSNAFRAAAKALDSQVKWTSSVDPALTGAQQVTLVGRANGAQFTAAASVDVGAAAAVPANPTTTSPGATSGPVPAAAAPQPKAPNLATPKPITIAGLPMMMFVAAATLFCGILALVVLLLSPSSKSSRRLARVESIEQYVNSGGGPAAPARTTSVSAIAAQLIEMGDKAVEGRESTSRTTLLLTRADLPWRAGEWAILRVLAVVICVIAGTLFLRGGLLTVLGPLLGLAVGVFGPPLVLKFLATRRAKKFERQLPDVLTLIASSLSTGFSLLQALDAVTHDVAEPAAKEFSRAMAETRIGSDIEESLQRMAERMDSTNMRWTAMAIQIQRQVGGNLGETLRTTAATLRDREALFRQVRALSAEGRLSAYILLALPVFIFLYMLQANPAYISLLWTNLIGIAMLAMALIMLVIGFFWMKKVVEVEV